MRSVENRLKCVGRNKTRAVVAKMTRAASTSAMVVVVLLLTSAVVVSQITAVLESQRRAHCLNNLRQICLGMIQYAGDYDDDYPNALDPKNEAAEPVQYRFTKLLKYGYLKNYSVFQCASRGKTVRVKLPDEPSEMNEADIATLLLNDKICSYGVDPKLNHTHGSARAMLADRPHAAYWGTGVSSPGTGKAGSNSENHKGEGQNVAYNDGHVKWHVTCKDDAGIDPNIYGVNPEINKLDDSNIDFGMKPAKPKK